MYPLKVTRVFHGNSQTNLADKIKMKKTHSFPGQQSRHGRHQVLNWTNHFHPSGWQPSATAAVSERQR